MGVLTPTRPTFTRLRVHKLHATAAVVHSIPFAVCAMRAFEKLNPCQTGLP